MDFMSSFEPDVSKNGLNEKLEKLWKRKVSKVLLLIDSTSSQIINSTKNIAQSNFPDYS